MADVARQAGLSVATVDRVLNARAPVRLGTAEKVQRAAREIDYHAAHLIGLRLGATQKVVRIGFVLQKPQQYFYQDLARAIVRTAEGWRGETVLTQIRHLEKATPQDVADAVRGMATDVDALALVSIDHPDVTAAVADIGKPVFTLLSDCAETARRGYLGLDNRAAGRTCAWFVKHFARRPGKVALFVGSHRYHGHLLREIGFPSWFGENAPEFRMLETVVNLDEPALALEVTLDTLRQHPDLVGLGVMGGGMEGVIEALRSETAPGDLAVVCNEKTPVSKKALAGGYVTAVMATPVQLLAERAVTAMVASLEDGDAPLVSPQFLPLEIIVAESL